MTSTCGKRLTQADPEGVQAEARKHTSGDPQRSAYAEARVPGDACRDRAGKRSRAETQAETWWEVGLLVPPAFMHTQETKAASGPALEAAPS